MLEIRVVLQATVVGDTEFAVAVDSSGSIQLAHFPDGIHRWLLPG